MPELVVSLKGRELQRFPITQRIVKIGRGGTSDLSLQNESVSREHARLSFVNQAFFIEGVSEHNLVLVNGQPCHIPRQIEDGDRIQVGKYTISLNTMTGPLLSLLTNGDFDEAGSTEVLSTVDIVRYSQAVDETEEMLPRSLEQIRLDRVRRLQTENKYLKIMLLVSFVVNLWLILNEGGFPSR